VNKGWLDNFQAANSGSNVVTEALAKVAAYRGRAKQVMRKTEAARVEELRRSYLILARQWHRMADELLVADHRTSAPEQSAGYLDMEPR